MYHTSEGNIPSFGEDINALAYLAWERKIKELHPFYSNRGKYYILSLCISSFIGHAKECWEYRQSRIEKGR